MERTAGYSVIADEARPISDRYCCLSDQSPGQMLRPHRSPAGQTDRSTRAEGQARARPSQLAEVSRGHTRMILVSEPDAQSCNQRDGRTSDHVDPRRGRVGCERDEPR
jgi:hypothetical protein